MDLLQKISIIETYEPGAIVVDRNTLDTNMYIVLEGQVTLSVHAMKNEACVASRDLNKGAFFGGMGLTDSMNRFITCQAKLSSSVMLISMKRVEEQRLFDRVNGEALYCNLLEKAEGFNDQVREIELETIRENHANKKKRKYTFLFNTPYGGVTINDKVNPYLLKRTLKCPVCRKSLETDTIRTSKLLLKSKGEYFINEYKDVEPLWLDMVVCPHCYYAERLHQFEKLTCSDIQGLYTLLLDIKSSMIFRYSAPRSAEQVINAYMIYEKCLRVKNVDPKVKAKGAILMAELYRRLGSRELAQVYYDKAFNYYHQLIEAGVVDVDEMQMQQLYIILGKLYERQGKYEEAKAQYKNAKVIFGVADKRYTNIADSYLLDLRHN